MATTAFAPKAEDNPWRVDTFMNTDEWKEVSRWYPFSLRSLMPDGRWFEYARCKMRDDAYRIMKALAAWPGRNYYVIVQCTLVGKDGREKAVVCSPGSENTLLRERQERIKLGWKVE
jgi:hypothetical protein